MFKKTDNQDGAILVMVMMTLTVLSLLALALATASIANINLTSETRDYQASYYIAEGGTNQSYAEIKKLVGLVYEQEDSEEAFYAELNRRINKIKNYSNYEMNFGEQPYADIEVLELNQNNPRSYQIVSKGVIGKRTRTVTRPFKVNWIAGGAIEIPEKAIAIIKNSISLQGGASLNGFVYLDSSDSNTIEMDGGTAIYNVENPKEKGIVFVPGDAVDRALNTPTNFGGSAPNIQTNQESLQWKTYEGIIESFPTFPSYAMLDDEKLAGDGYEVIKNGNLNINSWQAKNYTLHLNKSYSFMDINVDQNITLNIDTNNEDHDIVVQNLNLSNGAINLIGSGTVNIYVKGDLVMGSGSTINKSGDIKQVNLFLKGENKTINLGGSQRIYGSLFAEDANITFTAGGGFQGYILTGGDNVLLNGGTFANSFILAPYSDVEMSAGASLNGTVIATSLKGSGGASALFKSMDLDEFPFGYGASPTIDDLIKKQPTIEMD